MKKKMLTQMSNNYLYGDRDQCQKTGKLGTVMEVYPLDKIQVVWDDWVRVWLDVNNTHNPGYVKGISKIIGEAFTSDENEQQ